MDFVTGEKLDEMLRRQSTLKKYTAKDENDISYIITHRTQSDHKGVYTKYQDTKKVNLKKLLTIDGLKDCVYECEMSLKVTYSKK